MNENELIYKYWGKADKDGKYHLLVYHCLDVAAVGKVIENHGKVIIYSDILVYC